MKMTVFLDLGKAFHHLDMGKLVRKQVQVHGHNGRVFTRYQWVSPGEASTGHGVRKIENKEQMKQAFAHGVHEHPDFDRSLKHQGVDLADHDFKKHPHFFLPETKESSSQGKDLDNHYSHGSKVDHKVYNDEDFTPDSKSEKAPKPTSKVDRSAPSHERYANDKRIQPIIEALNAESLHDREDGADKYNGLLNCVIRNQEALFDTLNDQVSDDPDTDDHTKKVQKRNIKLLNLNPNGMLMAHPTIARAAVNKFLGEKYADQCRAVLSRANLTINCNTDHVDDILSNGYSGATLHDYVKNNLTPDSQVLFHSIVGGSKNTKQCIDAMDSAMDRVPKRDRESWGNVINRAEAELVKVGLTIKEAKPCYVALNPIGSSEGSCPFYGDAHVIVDNSILSHCTATTNDSFDEDAFNVPKVHDMDHLRDMFLLRQVQKGYDMHDPEQWILPAYDSDIRMELQYHKPSISKDKLSLGARELN